MLVVMPSMSMPIQLTLKILIYKQRKERKSTHISRIVIVTSHIIWGMDEKVV